jgi:hypothetical protein
MDVLAQVVIWLNFLGNALGSVVLAPIGFLPGWVSATLVAVGSAPLFLLAFKYASNQRAIKAVRSDIKANLLALKLFKESPWVTLRAQGRILWGALRSILLAIQPLLVAAVPACLLVSQLALWYQARPLRVGEETVLTMKLNGGQSSWPVVQLRPSEAVEVLAGPVRVHSKREICWSMKTRQAGYHRLVVEVGGQPIEKEVAVGNGFMRVSTVRPGWDWWDALWNPAESPLPSDSPIHSIEVEYPSRSSWTSGTDWWFIYWIIVSMIAAWCLAPWFNVKI